MIGTVEEPIKVKERCSLKRRELVGASKVICESNKEHVLRYDTINANNGLSYGTSIACLHILVKLGECLKDKRLEDATSDDINEYISVVKRGYDLETTPKQATFNLHKVCIKKFYRSIYNMTKKETPEQVKNMFVRWKSPERIESLKKRDHRLFGMKKISDLQGDLVPKILDKSVIDDSFEVEDNDVYHTVIHLARRGGILVGPTIGAIMNVALRYAKDHKWLGVVISPDDALSMSVFMSLI